MGTRRIFYTWMASPIGRLRLVASEAGLERIDFEEGADGPGGPGPGWERSDAALAAAAEELEGYFAGKRRAFDLALAPSGTPFEREVWRALAAIPYGTTLSYGELARRVGRPGAARAVGAANRRNPLPIVVPCHRVIGSDGSLTGYGGGIARKQALLALEASADRRARSSRAV